MSPRSSDPQPAQRHPAGDVLVLPVRVSRREVCRYLGYPRAQQPKEQVASQLEALWPLAMDLAHARGSFRLVGAQEAAAAEMPNPTDPVGVGLCTVGPALEEESERRGAAGDPLSALLLDALGSAAVEAAAEALSARLCQAARAQGRLAERRISPGYGRWRVTGQAALLRLLPHAALGVRLTDGMMMVPRKSVSFAVRLRQGEAAQKKLASRCEACDLENCPYRDDPADESGPAAREEAKEHE
jgi:hypothetical protein